MGACLVEGPNCIEEAGGEDADSNEYGEGEFGVVHVYFKYEVFCEEGQVVEELCYNLYYNAI